MAPAIRPGRRKYPRAMPARCLRMLVGTIGQHQSLIAVSIASSTKTNSSSFSSL
jgi:hypothetical protein